jgi:hypothetical protein
MSESMRQERPLISGFPTDDWQGGPAEDEVWISYYSFIGGGPTGLVFARHWADDLRRRLPAVTEYGSVVARPNRPGASLNFTLRGLRGGWRSLDAREALTELCCQTADHAGGRLRSLLFLTWEIAGGRLAGTHLAQARARRADPRFMLRFTRLLAHDAAVGSVRHPELIATLHRDFSPEAEVLARLAVGGQIGQQISPTQLGLELAALPELIAGLAETGWLEPPTQPLPRYISPGPLARQLSRRDLVQFR